MEGEMFNPTISKLTRLLYQHSIIKLHENLLQKVRALGLPVKQDFSNERLYFIIAQVIINLIDEIVLAQKDTRVRPQLLSVMQNIIVRDVNIQANSTLNNSPNCIAGNLHIAAQVFNLFCPRMSNWDVLDIINTFKLELEKQDTILQNIRLQNRILVGENLNKSFKCHCFFEKTSKGREELKCAHCSSLYHADCQVNVMLCSSCFLRFCVFDLKEQGSDLMNLGKEVEMSYFGYFESGFMKAQEAENIYFHMAKFDLPQMANVEKKDKFFYLKVSLADRIYNSDQLPISKSRKKIQILEFWQVGNTQYYFHLNHSEIKISQIISDNTIIFKLQPRNLEPKSNILVIRAICKKYPSCSLSYWKDFEAQKKVVMLGVYQTSKVRPNRNGEKGRLVSKADMMREMTYRQSHYYLQYVLKKVNQIEYQIVDLIDIISKQKIKTPVRSFGCTHLQCFDLDVFKQYRKNPQKRKPIKKQKKVIITVDDESVIDLVESSVVLIESSEQVIPNEPVRVEKRGVKRRKLKRVKKEKQSLFCPICNKKMLTLYIDPLFKQVLSHSGFHTKVKIASDGSTDYVL